MKTETENIIKKIIFVALMCQSAPAFSANVTCQDTGGNFEGSLSLNSSKDSSPLKGSLRVKAFRYANLTCKKSANALLKFPGVVHCKGLWSISFDQNGKRKPISAAVIVENTGGKIVATFTKNYDQRTKIETVVLDSCRVSQELSRPSE